MKYMLGHQLMADVCGIPHEYNCKIQPSQTTWDGS